jgi:C-terminal processing protease CtpA/Prc
MHCTFLLRFQGVKVARLVDGGSAQESGQIMVGDLIASINGTNALAWTLDQVKEAIQGKQGTTVTIGKHLYTDTLSLSHAHISSTH